MPQSDSFQTIYEDALVYRDEVAKRWETLEPTIKDYYTNVLGLKAEKDILVNIVNPKFNTGTNNMDNEIFYAHKNGKRDISYDVTYIMHEALHCLFPRKKEWTTMQYCVCHSLIELATDKNVKNLSIEVLQAVNFKEMMEPVVGSHVAVIVFSIVIIPPASLAITTPYREK